MLKGIKHISTMDLQQNYMNKEHSLKFSLVTDQMLSLTQSRICDRKLLNGCFKSINGLDYRHFIIQDKNAIMLLVNQLCSVIQPSEACLVIGYAQFLVNLIKCGVVLQGRTFTACKRWVLESLGFSAPAAAPDVLYALQSLLISGPFDSIIQDLRKLLGANSILLKHIHPQNNHWNEEQYAALGCFKAILINKEKSESSIALEFSTLIKSIVLQILSKLPYEDSNKLYYNKMASLCLRILRILYAEKSIDNKETVGELLGIVQVYLFHGIEGYPNIKPQVLRPAAMNLPDITQNNQKKKYFRNYKTKNKRPSKKANNDNKNESSPENKITARQSSDSDTSDTENRSTIQSEYKVRSEAIHLLSTIVEFTDNRELFGYWTQIVASGSRTDARVLTRCILRESNSKVRQISLSTLNDLLIGARMFLTHAEDVEQMSFVTFFSVLSSMIKEIHFTLSLLLSTERNVVVLIQGLKCASALAQGTPYSRLKPGLATKLVRNCRNHLMHKDPTVRVVALAVFETLAMSDPITPEIFNILAKSSNVDTDTELSNSGLDTANETETEEIVFDDFDENINEINFDTNYDNNKESHISALVQICFKNIARESANEPVRLQSLKLLGTLVFNASSLIFSRIEVIVKTLIEVTKEQESQVAFHACRVLEIIAGRLSETKSDEVSKFWNIAFNHIIWLVQNSQTNLKEVACDCLGNIGAEMLAQLSRDKSLIIISVLFGAVKDEESAVRAASLRALGLLVSLATWEEETGFLMDLTEVTCSASEDRNLGVRVKAAWAMASLCDSLTKQENNENLEPVPLEIVLPELYKTSVKAAQDNEKVRCNAVRAIGNIIYLCPDNSILPDTSLGLEALINCAITGNDMKVRWNACRAIGTVLIRDPDKLLPPLWKDKVFPVLCDLVCNSTNFKVRTNAAWALGVCNSFDKYIITLWKSIMLALENSQHVPSYVEYPHRDALVQQLCLSLCHLATYTDISELELLWKEIKDHFEDITHHMKHFQEHVLPEKAGDLIKAKAQFTSFTQQTAKSNEKQIAAKLLELFERDAKYDDMNAMSVLN